MLTAIRSKASSWVIKILFVVLVLSFAVWGIGDIFRGPGRQSVAIEVGDTEISALTVDEAYRNLLRQEQEQAGGQVDIDPERRKMLLAVAVQRLQDSTLQKVDLERLGLVVPDDLIRRTIEETFRGESGTFDRNLYGFYLQQNQLTEDRFVASLRSRIGQQQLAGALLSGVTPPKALMDAIHSYRGEARIAKTMLIPRSAVGMIADPAPDVLQAYYEENKEGFKTPEYRAVTLVILSPDELAKGIGVSDERLREAYEARKADLGVPERRHIRQFVVGDEAAAAAAAERLKAEPFDQVAKEVSGIDPIDLGEVSKADLAGGVPELAEAAFAATAPGVVGPVKTALGFHLLTVETIEPGHTPPFEEVRDTLRQSIAKEEAVAKVVEQANALDDARASGLDLEAAAAKLNLTVQKAGAVDASGNAPDGSAVSPIAGNETLLSMVFTTPAGETSTQQELGDGGYATVHVDGVQPAAPRPLEDARTEVVAAWLADEEDRQLAAKAEAAAERIRGGAAFETVAAELGVAVKTSSLFTRDQGDPAADVDRRLAASIFDLKPSEVATAPAAGGEVVAQLVEIKQPEPLAAEAAETMKSQLTLQLLGDLQEQYIRALRREIPVSTEQSLIDSLLQ